MAEHEAISLDHFRILTERAGLTLTPDELTALKPMYDHYAALIQTLHEVPLEAEDLAVTFSPGWDPRR
jgi:hypothetical protein